MNPVLDVAIATSEPIWGAGIRLALEQSVREFQFHVVIAGEPDWAAGLAACPNLGIAILEWTPGTSLDTLYAVRNAIPAAKLVVWGRSVPVEFGWQAIQSGVRAILGKGASMTALLQCLDVVRAGGTCFDNDLMAGMAQARTVSLTPRETQLVTLLGHGLKNKEIATALSLSEGTVKVYMSKLFDKLKVKDRFELALYGLHQMPEHASMTRSSLLVHPGGRAGSSHTHVPDPAFRAGPVKAG
jgi:DNA-binding NarL/FixJ family response regulator